VRAAFAVAGIGVWLAKHAASTGAKIMLAADLGASEAHRGQLTAAEQAGRSRAAGAEFGGDLIAIKVA